MWTVIVYKLLVSHGQGQEIMYAIVVAVLVLEGIMRRKQVTRFTTQEVISSNSSHGVSKWKTVATNLVEDCYDYQYQSSQTFQELGYYDSVWSIAAYEGTTRMNICNESYRRQKTRPC